MQIEQPGIYTLIPPTGSNLWHRLQRSHASLLVTTISRLVGGVKCVQIELEYPTGVQDCVRIMMTHRNWILRLHCHYQTTLTLQHLGIATCINFGLCSDVQSFV